MFTFNMVKVVSKLAR